MRLKHTVQVQLWQDTAGRRKLFDDSATAALTDSSGFDRAANSLLSIDADDTESLTFGDVTLVKGIYLEVDQEVQVTINGASDYLQLRLADGATKAKLFLEADISSVSIENTSDDVCTGCYCAWGDPTP